jgi:hypothetical protein
MHQPNKHPSRILGIEHPTTLINSNYRGLRSYGGCHTKV